MASKAINIAIDGPAGAGKSTIARLVAQELDFIYIDTGAMYRALTWKLLHSGVPTSDRAAVAHASRSAQIDLRASGEGQLVAVDGRDVTAEIRTPEITRLVPEIARYPEVREVMTAKQRQIASRKGVVMDGRDIGTAVLPDAEVKIFMTASVEERARRRYEEMRAKGQSVDLRELQIEIAGRDRMDREREIAPLKQAPDAVYLDTTELSIAEVAARIVRICREHEAVG